MLVRFYCPGHCDFMKKLTKKDAIEVAKFWVREFHRDVYIWKPLSGFNCGRFRQICKVTTNDI